MIHLLSSLKHFPRKLTLYSNGVIMYQFLLSFSDKIPDKTRLGEEGFSGLSRPIVTSECTICSVQLQKSSQSLTVPTLFKCPKSMSHLSLKKFLNYTNKMLYNSNTQWSRESLPFPVLKHGAVSEKKLIKAISIPSRANVKFFNSVSHIRSS